VWLLKGLAGMVEEFEPRMDADGRGWK